MNTLLQTAVNTWETHNRNDVASNMIIDGLVAVKQNKNSKTSPDAFEMAPVENRVKTAQTDNVLSELFECLSRALKASA